jgi:2-iminobutanoate/2-iminopropanoate deaminase
MDAPQSAASRHFGSSTDVRPLREGSSMNMVSRLSCAFVALALVCPTGSSAASSKPIAARGSADVNYYARPGSAAPFSPAVRVGDTLYLSGMIGARPDGTLPEGIEAQARQAMQNLGQSLRLAHSGFDDVVRCTAMLANMADWQKFNRVYVGYFRPGRLPARSAFGANGLAFGALVEIECQAHLSARAVP